MKRTALITSLMALALCALPTTAMADSDVTTEKQEQNTPDGWTAVQLPSIPAITASNTFTITDYGATTDSKDNTAAIQAALNAVPTTGGMVVIPKGTWLCGPLTIKTKTVLHLADGATVKLLPFGGINNKEESGSGYYPTTNGLSFSNFISVSSSDVIIEGESKTTSIIEGQGSAWWPSYKTSGYKRPCLIRFTSGQRYLVRDLRLQNSPGTNLTLGQSGKASNFTVHDVSIYAPASTLKTGPSHNTDGIPMWGPYINIYDCDIDTGDDNIVADSGTHHAHAWNLTFGAGHGASFGSYTSVMHDIIFEDITFNKTEAGFRLKTNKTRSGNSFEGTNANGAVRDIICRNATMTGVNDPIIITTWYDTDTKPSSSQKAGTITKTTPEICNVLFQNIKSTGTKYNSSFKHYNPIYIYGLPESYVHDITFDNVQIEAQKGMMLAYCNNIHFINGCKITNKKDSTKAVATKYEATYDGKIDGSDATGITTLHTTTTGDEAMYDLSGRRINNTHGIYIKGGHKYLNR